MAFLICKSKTPKEYILAEPIPSHLKVVNSLIKPTMS